MSSIGYTFSYSGADCKTFAFFPGVEFLAKKIQKKNGNKPDIDLLKKPIFLDSLATVSISVHEAKSPVRRLGERGVAGYTRGIRTIAGTMVFVVIEDHPLRKLAMNDPANVYEELIGWSRDLKLKGTGSIGGYGKGDVTYNNKIATLISPVNIVMHYQTEVGYIKDTIKVKDKDKPYFRSKLGKNEKFITEKQQFESGRVNRKGEIYKPSGASMMLEGVEFVNEGIVTSVNDLVTEVVVQFVAQDFTEFTYTGDDTDAGLTKLKNELGKRSGYSEIYRQYYEDLRSKPAQENNKSFGSVEVNIDGYK